MYGYKYPNWEPGMYYNTYQSSYPIRNPNQNYNYQQHHRRSLNNQNINYVPRQPRKNNYQCPENNNKTPPPLVKQKEVEKRKFDSSSLLNKTTISGDFFKLF
uniref:Uncharacterized protein n=1 Tax=Meloidogyne hapla TaxID=6305 RepID=A0A1I8BHP8_MELHA